MVALEREAGISDDGPSLGEFCEAVEGEASMDSRLPIGARLEIMRRNVHECLRGRE